ncbi:MAG: glycosyltransferase [Ginsengibacter sp.]
MVIAFNSLTPGNHLQAGHEPFIEAFRRLIKQYPRNTFIYITEALGHQLLLPENCIQVKLIPPSRKPGIWYLWYNYKIPLLLKKYKADLSVNRQLCATRTSIPQCLIADDTSYLQSPGLMSKSLAGFYKKNAHRFFVKAKCIVAPSQFCKSLLLSHYDLDEKKIEVVLVGADDIFKPAEIKSREKTKAQYAEGNEYFLLKQGNYLQHHLMNLLKAFSLFKKRLKSNMQLVFACNDPDIDRLTAMLRLYKYKSDVRLLRDVTAPVNAMLTAASYALIYPANAGCTGIPLIESMKSGIPVITSDLPSFREVCSDTALYMDPDNFEGIASQMMLLFKDERLRNELAAKCLQQVRGYRLETSTELLWSAITKTTG